MRRLTWILPLALLLCAAFATPAMADFGLKELDVKIENEDGSPDLQAGSHPFALTTTLGLVTRETPEGEVPEGEIKNLAIEQIPGLIGSQTAVPTCDQADFSNRVESRPSCSDSTAVGYASAEVEFKVIAPAERGSSFHVPVYNLDPPPGVAAELGFVVLNVPITIDVKVAESVPYNLVAQLANVPQAILLYKTSVTLWGNPAGEAHDSLRGNCLGEVAFTSAEPVSLGNCPANAPERAFLTLPRACAGPLSTVFSAISWLGVPAVGAAESHDEVEPKGIEGCEELDFEPNILAQTSSSSAESPTGLDFGLDVEDEGLVENPEERAQSDIREVVATLPPGMTINPSAAEGLGACSPAQYAAESLEFSPSRGCPESSKVGVVTVETPLLEEAVHGQLYVAEQGNNPFNSLFALYMVIRSERNGILIKQAGKVEPDTSTGQLRSTFEEIPQLPFSHFKLHFREGPRAPLSTPSSCGPQTATATFTPWSGTAPVTKTSSFQVTSGPGGGPCPSGIPGFNPGFAGGTVNNQAGAFSPFYMRITRNDGEQAITRFDSVLPPGLVGKIAGLGRCPEEAITAAKNDTGRAELAGPSCPASSRIGSIVGGAGVGSSLTYVSGSLYLAGPYRGDPLSIVAITPAVAGPFDLGTVVVREALTLNPTTAEVEVDGGASDPIPTIIKGVPLHLRDLRIYIDRPEFTLNATSCEPEALKATLFGSAADLLSPADDVGVPVADHYQAANCGALGYRPKLSLKLLGATKRSKFPAVHSTLIPRVGEANTARAVVTLPPSEQLENAHITNPCTRVQFAADACPKASILGTAKAISPLLDQPLEGPVYFRSNGGERKLPDIVADLNGQFRIILVGFIDSKKGRIRTTFASVPDAPVSRFELDLYGGKRGLLVNNRNICAHKQRAKLALTGQNGARSITKPVIKTSCKKKREGR